MNESVTQLMVIFWLWCSVSVTADYCDSKGMFQSKIDAYTEDWNSGNVTRHMVAKLYTDDVTFMAQGEEGIYGLDDITALFASWHHIIHNLHITVEEAVQLSETRAYHIERANGTDIDGVIVLKKHRALSVWKKVDAGWRIEIQMSNERKLSH